MPSRLVIAVSTAHATMVTKSNPAKASLVPSKTASSNAPTSSSSPNSGIHFTMAPGSNRSAKSNSKIGASITSTSTSCISQFHSNTLTPPFATRPASRTKTVMSHPVKRVSRKHGPPWKNSWKADYARASASATSAAS
ncbi:MAG: hypothetical protein Q9198_009070 [Flavoplaca austrocitrina]